MNRLTEYTVASGFRIACRFATWPTSRWPSSVKATTDGVVRLPSAFGITSALPPSTTAATTEFVVPRSMPTAFAIALQPPFLVALMRLRRSVPGVAPDDVEAPSAAARRRYGRPPCHRAPPRAAG